MLPRPAPYSSHPAARSPPPVHISSSISSGARSTGPPIFAPAPSAPGTPWTIAGQGANLSPSPPRLAVLPPPRDATTRREVQGERVGHSVRPVRIGSVVCTDCVAPPPRRRPHNRIRIPASPYPRIPADLHDYHLRLDGHAWSIQHRGAILSE